VSPAKRIRTTVARRGRIENDAARQQLALLRKFRGEILGELAGGASSGRPFQLHSMLRAIDTEIRRFGSEAEADAAAAVRKVWQVGEEAGAVVGAPPTLFGTSRALLQAVVDVTTDQTREVWSELGTRLKRQIRQTTLGLTNPYDSMVKVARLIKDPKTFGRAFTRAETIVRTEVNRGFALASKTRAAEANEHVSKTGKRVVKYWLSADDSRVREDHDEAAITYSKERPIPVDEPFIVGGEELMQPLDPSGSAEQTINCRCVAVYMVVTEEEFAELTKAA
jgi:hypothetical protein